MRSNDVDAAMGAARLALEPVRNHLETLRIAGAAPSRAKERSQTERNALLVEAAYSQLCGAMHDDEITKTFRYTRTQAATLIALVAGFVRDASESL